MLFYKGSIESLFEQIQSSSSGLSNKQAERRLEQLGFNELDTELRINKFKLFISQFKSFIIYILLFAVALSIYANEIMDAAIIMAILLVNALIGYFQELSAQKSLSALKKFDRVKVTVWRNLRLVELDAKFLVPGDVIDLSPGDKVPADCRLIEANQLKVQESTLTGESVAVNKAPCSIDEDVQIGAQSNMLFSSTSVIAGMATALVVKTGMQTEIGQITKLIRETEEEATPLQLKMDAFGKKLTIIIMLISVLIFCVIGTQEFLQEGFNFAAFREIALISVALAVAAIPEGLPAVVTITLSIGVKKLLKKQTLVKRLSSVETLGSCDVICTDKTGTLTRNEMMVSHVWTPEGEAMISGQGYEPIGNLSNDLSPLIYEIGMVCNSATVFKEDGLWQITGDPTEAALLTCAMKAGIENDLEKVAVLPFDTERKKMSVKIKRQDNYFVYTKGAPDQTLEDCCYVMVEGAVMPLTNGMKQTIHDQINHYSSQALRVIAFAYKKSTVDEQIIENELIFVGLQAMIDPPRDDVIESIKRTKQAGIRVIMITGDYKQTALAIGEKVGIQGTCMEGKDLDDLSVSDLQAALANGVNIFSRTIPVHKQKIIAALQAQGSIVAMTGDGVNDAPALKKADIGVVVGSGTDVAKEASDFVLLDDSFTHIINAIEQGRGIYNNIQKTIMHLLSGNLAEVLIVFFAVILGWDLPLTVVMILWINLISDGAPALALAVDSYDENLMLEKPNAVSKSILTGPQAVFVVFFGILSTVFTLIMFRIYHPDGLIEAQTVVFNVIVVIELSILFVIRSLFHTKQLSNGWLWVTVVMTLLLQLVLMYTPAATLFGVYPLTTSTLFWILAVGLLVFLIGQVYTRLANKSSNISSKDPI